MTFIAAGFLAGLLAAVIPWWLHRLETRSAPHRTVSSLFLMREAQEPSMREKRLRHLLLLALRIVLLVLLVLAFAQPVLERFAAPVQSSPERARIIVVDVSASMARGGVFSRTLEIARELVGGRTALVAAGSELEVISSLTRDHGKIAAGLGILEPTAARLSFDGLLGRISALAGSLADAGEPLEIHLISDFQANAFPPRFNALVSGVTHRVILHRVGRSEPNWAIAQLNPRALVVRGFNTAERVVPVTVKVDGAIVLQSELEVRVDGRVTLDLPPVEAGRHDRVIRAELGDRGALPIDALSADNVRYAVAARQRDLRLPVIGGSQEQLVYVRAALAASRSASLREGEAEGDKLNGVVALLVDPGTAPADLRRYLDEGGAVLATVGPAVGRAGSVPILGNVAVADADPPARVLALDEKHPALGAPGSWDHVTVFRYLTGELAGADVLLALDNGAPLLVERRVGRGRLLVLLTGLDSDWSSLATGPAFVSFLDAALAYLSEDLIPTHAIAGGLFRLPASNVQLLDPAGDNVLSLAESLGRSAVAVAVPGIYELRTAARQSGTGGRRFLAVNPDSAESDLEPVADELFERWRQAVEQAGSPNRTVADRQPGVTGLALAPWLLLALVGLVILEPMVANGRWRESGA
jgi:hypothetical protein